MRYRSLVLILLVLAVVPAARGAAIDTFTLTGPGLAVTYSEDATFTTPDFSLFNFYGAGVTATINGVPGYSVGADYYAYYYPYASLVYTFPSGSGVTPPQLLLDGVDVYSFYTVPATNPPGYFPFDIVGTFIPGTYTEYYTPLAIGSSPVAYTLSIAPETALTPEPSTFALLGTAAAFSLVLVRRRSLKPRMSHFVGPAGLLSRGQFADLRPPGI